MAQIVSGFEGSRPPVACQPSVESAVDPGKRGKGWVSREISFSMLACSSAILPALVKLVCKGDLLSLLSLLYLHLK